MTSNELNEILFQNGFLKTDKSSGDSLFRNLFFWNNPKYPGIYISDYSEDSSSEPDLKLNHLIKIYYIGIGRRCSTICSIELLFDFDLIIDEIKKLSSKKI